MSNKSNAHKYGEKLGRYFRPKSEKTRDLIGYSIATLFFLSHLIIAFASLYITIHFIIKFW